uniref:ADAM metallopeptidase domain 12 n=1 Tax=Ornithorhynchus anatinus TaxID=9258 RepID=A0A6I8NNB9_ORNAN
MLPPHFPLPASALKSVSLDSAISGRCYYHGSVRGSLDSSVSLAACSGLRQGKDIEKVKQRLIEMANHVDKLYRPLNVRIVLVGVEVWSSLDRCTISQDPFLSLHEFLDWRKLKLLPRRQHDNAQLVSGVFFQGTTVGVAPLLSMCTVEQSGGIVMDHSDHPVGTAVTLAHELGTTLSPCPHRYPLPGAFSSCSERDLEESLQKGVGTCLFNLPDAKESLGARRCGNGFVEEGEECDCGEPEECTSRCCNATSCTLKPGAVCAHGLCCEDCQLKPAGVCCRASSNPCDLPEFCTGAGPHCPGNVYLHDGLPCARVDGYCYSGLCRTHQDQCAALWGPGAKAAPGICFERVNAAGDPYGNCGKQSRTSFAKCEARDAKCGKIQCQGGASRPVIGTNAVSIETNIALQDGGRIRCRGTHVYLGDDVPDPGLVLAGTKCGEGKICLNRRCQNVSVFGVWACLAKCHGRGVCNNHQNCHCEAEWAPPFCDVPGFGGSVDSGPVRRPDGGGRALGLLGTLLGLAAAGSALWLQRKAVLRVLLARERLAARVKSVQGTPVLWAGRGRAWSRWCWPSADVPGGPRRDICALLQETQKPNPPQKPLPADPLTKAAPLTRALGTMPVKQGTGLPITPAR